MERDREPVKYNAGARAMLGVWVENRCVISDFSIPSTLGCLGAGTALGLPENVSLDPVSVLFSIRTLAVDSAGTYSTSNSISSGHTHTQQNWKIQQGREKRK